MTKMKHDHAAEPPAPPAQALTQEELEGAAFAVSQGRITGHLNRITFSHEALRAEVARLQEELTQRTQERDDSDLAFNTANDIIGKLEAEAQALRERLTHATYAVRLFRTDTYDLGAEAFCDKLLALLSPAQEAP
jgi:HSP90 family molecular chaperone